MEGGTAVQHVDSKGRRCELDKTENAAGPPSQSTRNKDSQPGVQRAASAARECGVEAISEIMGICWESAEVTKMVQELQERW